MESVVIYELARNNVYGSLSRALGRLRHEIPGLLAQERAKIPEFTNDALFLLQTGMAVYTIAALQKFCEARTRREDFYQARQTLMKNFEMLDQPFSDEKYIAFGPSVLKKMGRTKDKKKEETYRYGFLDEFREVLVVLDHHMEANGAMNWAGLILLNKINAHLPEFIDPARAHEGFGRYPVTKEAQFFADVAKWLKLRSVAAATKASPLFQMDARRLGGVFEKAAENTPADRMRLQHYAMVCEMLGGSIAELVANGGYVPVLRRAGFTKKDELKNIKELAVANIRVNLPGTLQKFADGFVTSNTLTIDQSNAEPLVRHFMMQALDDVMADLTSEFPQAPVTKALRTKASSVARIPAVA